MSPNTTKLFMRLKIANIMTIKPADLKNILFLELLFILNEPKLTRARTGNVPRAKASIVSPPVMKLPVVKV